MHNAKTFMITKKKVSQNNLMVEIMAYVRINMVEFDSPEEFKKRVKHFQKNCADIFPTAQVLAGVQTGEANVLSISIYPDKETADASLIDREKHFDAVMPKDIMYLIIESLHTLA